MTVYELPEITSNGWWVSGRIWRFARLGSVLYSIRIAASNRGGVFPSRFCGAGVPVEVGVEDAASGTICVVGAARLEPLAKLAAIFRGAGVRGSFRRSTAGVKSRETAFICSSVVADPVCRVVSSVAQQWKRKCYSERNRVRSWWTIPGRGGSWYLCRCVNVAVVRAARSKSAVLVLLGVVYEICWQTVELAEPVPEEVEAVKKIGSTDMYAFA